VHTVGTSASARAIPHADVYVTRIKHRRGGTHKGPTHTEGAHTEGARHTEGATHTRTRGATHTGDRERPTQGQRARPTQETHRHAQQHLNYAINRSPEKLYTRSSKKPISGLTATGHRGGKEHTQEFCVTPPPPPPPPP